MTLRTKALLSILIDLPVAKTLENRARLISSLKNHNNHPPQEKEEKQFEKLIQP
jgi:hypothetical protein